MSRGVQVYPRPSPAVVVVGLHQSALMLALQWSVQAAVAGESCAWARGGEAADAVTQFNDGRVDGGRRERVSHVGKTIKFE